MRRTFAKLMAMLLLLTLALTGCNLIKEDQIELMNQQMAELEEIYSAVLAEYEGGTVTIFDALAPFYSNYSYTMQMYSMIGMELSDEDIADIQENAVESEVINRAISMEFEKRGLTLEQTDEEIRAEVEAAYADAHASYLDYVEGETDEEKAAAAELALYAEGFTRERLYEMYVTGYQSEVLQAAVEAEITEVTEEALQTAYDERVAADEETYTTTPTYFESDATDETAIITWRPEGYRSVKHVLVIPEDEFKQAVIDARSALETAVLMLESLEAEMEKAGDDEESRTAEEIQANIDAKTAELSDLEAAVAEAEAACLESVKDKTDLIYEELASGKPFDEVMAEYGEDPGMQSEPSMTTGYYVSDYSDNWDENFTAGAMALTEVGEYSAEPVISTSGVHIIYYNSDVTPGAVPMEEVRDALYDEALAAARTEHYQNLLTELVEALNPVYHMENWIM